MFCFCPRKQLDDVRTLDYRHSGLSHVPGEVFNCERTLEELYVDSNEIKDLPRELFFCHSLTKLSISDNDITSIPPAIGTLSNLEEIDCSKNGILDIPENIKSCKNLRVVEASVNPFGKLPDGFTQLHNITHLYLNDTFLEYLPGSFGRLERLVVLELRENHLKTLPRSISRLSQLERLDIGMNDFTELPDVLCFLHSLLELWCDCNKIVELPSQIGNLKQLMFFDATKNQLSSIPPQIGDCVLLSDLHLSSNSISSLPESVGNLVNITTLKVDDNQLTSLPQSLGKLSAMSELNISTNDIEHLPSSIGLLHNLRTLYADENFIKDLPPDLGSCSGVTVLSLRSNRLCYLPDEIGRISQLRVLNLSDNRLQYLPYSLTRLKQLQALWLSESQMKPLLRLQSEVDHMTGRRMLTCYLLPQLPRSNDEDYASEESTDDFDRAPRETRIQFKFPSGSNKSKHAASYPKEVKSNTRHAKNEAVVRQGNSGGSSDEEKNGDISPLAQERHNLFWMDKEKKQKDKKRLQESHKKAERPTYQNYDDGGFMEHNHLSDVVVPPDAAYHQAPPRWKAFSLEQHQQPPPPQRAPVLGRQYHPPVRHTRSVLPPRSGYDSDVGSKSDVGYKSDYGVYHSDYGRYPSSAASVYSQKKHQSGTGYTSDGAKSDMGWQVTQGRLRAGDGYASDPDGRQRGVIYRPSDQVKSYRRIVRPKPQAPQGMPFKKAYQKMHRMHQHEFVKTANTQFKRDETPSPADQGQYRKPPEDPRKRASPLRNWSEQTRSASSHQIYSGSASDVFPRLSTSQSVKNFNTPDVSNPTDQYVRQSDMLLRQVHSLQDNKRTSPKKLEHYDPPVTRQFGALNKIGESSEDLLAAQLSPQQHHHPTSSKDILTKSYPPLVPQNSRSGEFSPMTNGVDHSPRKMDIRQNVIQANAMKKFSPYTDQYRYDNLMQRTRISKPLLNGSTRYSPSTAQQNLFGTTHQRQSPQSYALNIEVNKNAADDAYRSKNSGSSDSGYAQHLYEPLPDRIPPPDRAPPSPPMMQDSPIVRPPSRDPPPLPPHCQRDVHSGDTGYSSPDTYNNNGYSNASPQPPHSYADLIKPFYG